MGIAMLVEVDEKGGGEDIAGSSRVDLDGRVSGEAGSCAALKERGSAPPIGRDQQWNMRAPVRQYGISGGAPIIRERQQVVVAKNQCIEQRKKLLGSFP